MKVDYTKAMAETDCCKDNSSDNRLSISLWFEGRWRESGI